ncbi:hypothetical protein [Treponema pedis]|uniref:Uncharacterized protein n=1 Tax=Treponema pedis TaxID=409322 RepID=A0A7S7AWK3_9SPIR|nr:hypothetical protein [Treponema pedis]QOW60784.1 hypothetical protein IFE08_13530 [Treponema pedis]
MKQKKLISMVAMSVILIGMVFIMEGCRGSNGTTNNSSVSSSGGGSGSTIVSGSIEGIIWKMTKPDTSPDEITLELKNGKAIVVSIISGISSTEENTYTITGNKITLPGFPPLENMSIP